MIPLQLVQYGHVAFLGGTQSGSIGVQGHYANALAAIFIACGQDAACVSEASTGLTDMDLTEQGDLYVSVTLPNLIVGTVGGDRLTICLTRYVPALQAGQRPSRLAADPNSGQVLMVLEPYRPTAEENAAREAAKAVEGFAGATQSAVQRRQDAQPKRAEKVSVVSARGRFQSPFRGLRFPDLRE